MRKKRTKRTPTKRDWAPRFLNALAKSGVILHACKALKVTRSNVYERRDNDTDFAAALARALEDACDALEIVARRRAIKKSDGLLQFLLRAHRPEKFRENHKVEHTGRVAVEVRAEDLTDDELATIAARGRTSTDA
jgi:hypothetical protein